MKNIERGELDLLIKEAGFRVTTPRRHVLNLLGKESKPLSIQEIAKKLSARKIDQVTVYRMVEAFAKKGILREVNLRGEHPRYELQDEHDHHHIVCTSCDRVEDFVGCEADDLAEKVLEESRSFSKITGHSFDLYGLCKICAK